MIDFKKHKPHDSRSFPWFGALVILNALDVLFTWKALQLGASEANPVFAWLLPNLDIMQAIIVVKIAALALCQTAWKYMRLWQKIGLDIIYSGVVLYSLYYIL